MKKQSLIVLSLGFILVMGFQNCSGTNSPDEPSNSYPVGSEKASLEGRFEVDKFISTSSCPDVSSADLVCSSIFSEEESETFQSVEFMSDGTLIVEGACNTYFSQYRLEGDIGLGHFYVDELSGTSKVCSGAEAEEENLLLHRLAQSVRIVADSAESLTIYTDQSSALKLTKKL